MAQEDPHPNPLPQAGEGAEARHPAKDMSRESQSSPLSRSRERARVRARALRQSGTDAEALIWSRLRNRQLLGLKFRRQHPIAGFIADFACLEIGLVIELDGGQHNEPSALASDTRRAAAMAAAGFKTIRFWNNDVLARTDAVLEHLLHSVQALTPALSRKRERAPDTSHEGH